MKGNYLPIILFIIVSIIFAAIPIMINFFCALHKKHPAKNLPYECGFDQASSTKNPINIRFYLLAILFLLFDIETIFFLPWAVSLRRIGWLGFFSMLIFLGILLIGFLYEWRKGALEWE